jgi:hypothetical protein
MAELLPAITTAAVGSAAPAATVAGTAGLFGAGGAFNLGTTLTTLMSLGSAGLSIASGLSQAQAYGNRAFIEEINARQDLVRGQHESNKIRENLLRTLAAQSAYFGSGGIDIGSGTPVDLATETQAQADRELNIVRENATLLSAQRRLSAMGLRSDESAAQVGGFGRGALTLLDYGTRLAGR